VALEREANMDSKRDRHQASPTPSSPVLDTRAGAAYLGLGRRTLQMLAESGKIPRIRLSPGRVGFLRRDLDAYLERQRG
jgi:excisionase family DNA binding protein